MIRELESELGWNLRRWQESGEPRRWMDCHRGRWGHDDWLALLEHLVRSSYWPLDPAAVGMVLEESRRQYWNLRRWQESGAARKQVDAWQGQWNHDDWLALLADLEQSSYWPLDLAAVGALLEDLKLEWLNLQRWQQSGSAHAWVEAHQGRWGPADWRALQTTLRLSEFWPLDLVRVEKVLHKLTAEWLNLYRWQRTGQARLWVELHGGQWDHDAWVSLLESLQQSQYWPLDPEVVGELLEEAKRRYWNLRHWQQSGEPQRWVDARQGRWSDQDVVSLLADLAQSRYWPLDPAVVEAVLEECRNLRNFAASDEARNWVDARKGRWMHDDWLALLGQLQRSRFWPLDPAAVGEVLRKLNLEWWNLRRWRTSGLAWKWVDAHAGSWTRQDWHTLLSSLQSSEFWPANPGAIARVVEEVKLEWQRRHRQQPPTKEAA